MSLIFQFNTVERIKFASGSVAELAQIAGSLGITKPCIVTDAGIIRHNLLDSALNSFANCNIEPFIYSDVVADPPAETVSSAVDEALSNGCDGVIGFGGGSSMDVAKLVAVLLTQRQTLDELYGVDCVVGSRLPLVQVPTTAGTGSEATNIAIVTTGESTKAGIVSQQLYADYIVLDPELTLGLPGHVTAATGIDAMVHAIEAYTSKRLKNPVSDMLALRALELLSSSIRVAVDTPSDLSARSDMLLGAMFAGQAFANAPVGAVHALAYPLGGVYHVPHGLSNSLVLPHVLRFNARTSAGLYQEVAQIILRTESLPKDHIETVDRLAEYFLDLATDLELPTKLSQMDIPIDALPHLAEQAMLQQRLLINNPREVSYDNALDIYQTAY